MAVRRRAQTQTEAYWRRDFRLRPEDLESIYDLMLDDGRPRLLDDLVCEVMERHCRREAQARLSAEAQLYRPREHYAAGQEIVFPNLDYATGKVVAVRPGLNPRYGEFSVITIAFQGREGTQDFAAEFKQPHPLNELNEEAPAAEEGELSLAELCQRYGEPVRQALVEALPENPEFVPYDSQWFLRGLLPEVHVGHLNLAEAVIDVAGHPLGTAEILQQVELPAAGKPQARAFALNLALQGDGRFDNVGTAAGPRWFLYNLEPPAVASKPDRLQPDFHTTGRELAHRESLEIAQEIGDELDELAAAAPAAQLPESGKISFVLNYPHKQSGTLPLTRQILALFPSGEYTRIPVHFVDGRTDARWMGWILPQEGYGWGLGEWYEREEVPAGATVDLLLTKDPYTVVVRCEARSRRTEWARVPRVENNRLVFEIRKRAYTCRYDRNLLVGEPTDRPRLDELQQYYRAQRLHLFQAIMSVFPELVKLGSQGFVHAKALYAALNVPWRTGAIPVFAELARHACFDPVGDGNWAFDESLVDAEYTTPEEMEARPSSRRVDVIHDRVLRYGSLA
ncbi:MAG TPA: hypothetical protein PLJ35_20305 [Anaerolineae bacterium]|nr:hypothetical protein [Anaerolineae bacterium]HOR01164.1 hypothetical protein [Anaerolineae bacterium]HPL29211.1 hypothetical protein [Anaerolineae bacterium]